MGKAGFVTIIGKPNVGKSTLMNTLIGQKIAITSYKPQTTRSQIRTIYTEERGQIVFLDTPGLHAAKDRLGRYMEKSAESALKDVDAVLWLVEPKEKLTEEDRQVLAIIAKAKAPVIIVITKIDTVKKEMILAVISAYASAWKAATGHEIPDIIPVSARTKAGLDDLKTTIFDKLPEGEPYYDADQVTTQTEREIAGEIIREKALRLLQEEVPHGIAVEINTMHTRRSKRTGEPVCDIEADIICERESHKGIIIGKGGEMLKKIGTAARIDIENMVGTKVNLKLFVKVRKDWKDNEGTLNRLGYSEKSIGKEE